ncbi:MULTISPECIES: ORF6N domain-containing protein [Serratia]|uniref:ORF6N domain-containing protein n=1 Tax=Serratia TaxID=613 RepID=UPI001CBB0503|nr:MULTISPECIES: ORF6N domain-containing protein [Serratia]
MRSVITVHNNRVPLVEFQGQRVVTFAMVDIAHQRPKDTARKAFKRNRARFIEGEDFFIVAASKVDWANTGCLARGMKRPGKELNSAIPIRGKVTLITESGYLLLTKPFNDDLAWQVQRQLVKAYFRHIPQFPELHKVRVPDAAELIEMPLPQAQNLIAEIERESFTQHGQKGSAAMRLRRDELKKLRPATRFVRERGQIEVADTGDYADE